MTSRPGQEALELRPLRDAELPQVIDVMRPAYAAERAHADHLSYEEALAFVARQYAELLPNGVATAGHHFAWLNEAETQSTIGFVWYFFDQSLDNAYVYYLYVAPEHRRQGFATAALKLVEQAARSVGCVRIGLNVFAPNEAAKSLYRQAQYAVVSQHLNKAL